MRSLPENPRMIADYIWGRHQGRVTYSVLCEELLYQMTEEDPEEFEEDPEMIEEEPEKDPIVDPIESLEAVLPGITPNESRLRGIILATALVSVLVGVVVAYLVY